MAQSKSNKNKKVGVEPLAEDIDDEVTPVEDDEDEDEALADAKAREADDDEDEDDDEEEVEADEEDDEDDEDEDEEDDEVVEEETKSVFAPYVYSGEEDTTWDLKQLFEEVDGGETIYIYDVENEVFYKLMPVEVGELS